MLLRRGWAQFAAALPDEAMPGAGATSVDILKLDMVGCPSNEWKQEEKLGSLMDPRNWFRPIVEMGLCDTTARSGLVIVDDLRPPGERLAYGMVLSQKKHKAGFIRDEEVTKRPPTSPSDN